MLPTQRRRGPKPKDPSLLHRQFSVSLPPVLIAELQRLAEARKSKVSPLIQEFIERGLIEHEIRQRRDMQEVA